jgi:hypothetical protein
MHLISSKMESVEVDFEDFVPSKRKLFSWKATKTIVFVRLAETCFFGFQHAS